MSIDLTIYERGDPFRGDAVGAIASTLAVLSSDRLVDDKTTDFAPYGLKDPILTLVVGRKDGKTHTLHLGDNAPSGSAAYARVEGESRLFMVSTSTKSALLENHGLHRSSSL